MDCFLSVFWMGQYSFLTWSNDEILLLYQLYLFTSLVNSLETLTAHNSEQTATSPWEVSELLEYAIWRLFFWQKELSTLLVRKWINKVKCMHLHTLCKHCWNCDGNIFQQYVSSLSLLHLSFDCSTCDNTGPEPISKDTGWYLSWDVQQQHQPEWKQLKFRQAPLYKLQVVFHVIFIPNFHLRRFQINVIWKK